MPNCDFYACGEDHRLILERLISEGQCEIWETYSNPGEECQRFTQIEDFPRSFGFSDWESVNAAIHLNLYPKDADGQFRSKRIELKKPTAPDKAFRFATEGWGLIQLYLEPPRKGILQSSHTNHNSETRARNWYSTIPDMGDPGMWNWSAVNAFSRRLNSFIRKSAVDKIHSQVILPQAQAMRACGLKFWPWDRNDG